MAGTTEDVQRNKTLAVRATRLRRGRPGGIRLWTLWKYAESKEVTCPRPNFLLTIMSHGDERVRTLQIGPAHTGRSAVRHIA
jgi:hypothetical protein